VQPGSRDLGSISAEFDERFQRHFVATPEFANLLSDHCMIVAGAKGSGKTAIMRALTDIDFYRKKYAAVYPVKLDGLKFAQLYAAIKRLNDASDHGIIAITRTAWQNVIAVYVLEAALQYKLVGGRDRGEIRKYLTQSGYHNSATSDRLLGHLERVWQLLAKLSREKEDAEVEPLIGLRARQQKVIGAFPSDRRLDDYLTATLQAIRSSGKRLLVCLDGLDSVVEYSVESRDLIFAGLIDAIHKCATDSRLQGTLIVKALIPKELAQGARARLRDLDKIDQIMESIHWDTHNLGEFIRKRLEEHLRTKGRSFEEVWHEFFPDRVRNDIHSLEEDTYEYLLRHTLFRPRQLLLHVQNILNAWDRRAVRAPFKVDPKFIPRVVAQTNNELAEYVVNELSLDFPTLSHFLKSFRGLPSVMGWSEFSLRMERFLGVPNERVADVFTDLYNYGIFGVALAQGKPGQFAFGFMTRRVERNVASGMKDNALVAIAPMFVEYCNCKPSPVGIVAPCA
jgi:hypothetical protein